MGGERRDNESPNSDEASGGVCACAGRPLVRMMRSQTNNMLQDLLPLIRQQEVAQLLCSSVGSPTPAKLQRVIGEYASESDRRLYGLRRSGRFVGCIGLRMFEPGRARILHLSVLPDCRGRGSGRELVERAMSSFALLEVTAETDDDARGFYERCGFCIRELRAKHPGRRRYACTRRAGGGHGVHDSVISQDES